MTVNGLPDIQPGLEVIHIEGEFELIHDGAKAVDKVVDVGDIVGLGDFLWKTHDDRDLAAAETCTRK